MRRRATIGLTCAAALTALTACGADRDDAVPATTTTSTAASAATTIAATQPRWEIRSWEFVTEVAATAGEPIEVVNADGADHTLTDVDGSFEAYVQADGSTVLTIDRPGTYAVWCRIHPDMRGTVVVESVP